ncbi:MAG TPA: tRNA (adenosine(37)-N6)-threonylcarbamoyltransferase complex dimerization subunit type 1 TsaB [Thermoanaerobaculia bacterium]|jgi:tRNA threonylcarbamoyl adenosine modification protein YeaZ
MPFPLLLLDTGSPLVSVAVAREGAAAAVRAVEQQRSSALLLDLIREALDEAEVGIGDLGGIAALRGPGSFTGLRIGLATALGLHQALGVPATALPSLQALAAAVPPEVEGTVVAAVDALRGEWSAQAFAAGPVPRPLGEMDLVPGPELPRLAGGRPPAVVVGFGVLRLAGLPGWPAGPRLIEPGALAPIAAHLAVAPGVEWNPDLLVSPIYSRPPAISLPRLRAAVAPREA